MIDTLCREWAGRYAQPEEELEHVVHDRMNSGADNGHSGHPFPIGEISNNVLHRTSLVKEPPLT